LSGRTSSIENTVAEAGGEASDAARGAGSSLKVPFFACGELFLSEALSLDGQARLFSAAKT